jgi:CxxC motif-containing protein
MAPRRMVTCAVAADNGRLAMGSLTPAGDVPKEKIFDVIRAMKAARLTAPVKIGDVIIEDVANTGVPVVSTKAVPALG